MVSLKKKVFAILETNTHKHFLGKFIKIAIVSLILMNVLAVILETVDSIDAQFHLYFDILEIGSACIFGIEYLLRVWVCDIRKEFRVKWGRIKYMSSPLAIIDFFSIFPFFFILIANLDFRVVMLIRFFRLLRLFKLRRYSHAAKTLRGVLEDKKEELIITFTTIIVLLIIASSLMFIIEHEAQPEIFSSIPATMWWGVATLTTVGYGDMVPITPLGKMLGAVIAILGLAMFALPAGLISSGFNEYMKEQRDIKANNGHDKSICPHCHKKITDH
jgi:voltage-gated potassium channel